MTDMKREAFPFRTMSEVRTGLGMLKALHTRAKGLGDAMRRWNEDIQPAVNEGLLRMKLNQERMKFARQDQSLARTRRKNMQARARAMGTKLINERLMELRAQLQRERAERSSPVGAVPMPTQSQGARHSWNTYKKGRITANAQQR